MKLRPKLDFDEQCLFYEHSQEPAEVFPGHVFDD